MSSLREQLIRDEGRRGTPYRDIYGFQTIGVGWNLDAFPLPDEVIDLMLDIAIARVQGALKVRIPWYLDLAEPRRAVLESMAYQMGVGGLMGFRAFLASAQAGDFAQGAYHMLDSKWAKEDSPERARKLAEQWKTGTWIA